jgi:peptide/nickel transport system permease protein
MVRYMVKRFLQGIVLLIVVSIIMFVIIRMAPGGPAILLQQDITKEMAVTMARELGLDRPIAVQYLDWASNVLKGNLGQSLSLKLPVAELIRARMGATLWLAGLAMLLAVCLAIPLGVISAVRRYSIFDYLATGIAFFGISVPVFWFGLMLIILFSVTLQCLPSGGMYTIGADFSDADRLKHALMPAIVLSSASMAQLARYTRSSMLSALREDFVRTARSKGLSERIVIYKHALRNALIPVVTMLGVIVPRLVGGAAITETIFSWPGMGRLAVDAAFQRDYPVIMAVTLLVSLIVIVAGQVVDLIYVLIDPRIKYD